MEKSLFYAKVAKGLETIAAQKLENLGAKNVSPVIVIQWVGANGHSPLQS